MVAGLRGLVVARSGFAGAHRVRSLGAAARAAPEAPRGTEAALSPRVATIEVPRETERRALRWMLVVGLLLAFAVVSPFAGVLVVAAWFGHLAQPILAVTAKLLGGRNRAAAVLTILLLVVLLTPVTIVTVVSATTAIDLFHRLQATPAGDALIDTFRGAAKDGAVRAAQVIGRGASDAILAFAIFLLGAYTSLVEGDRAWGWLASRVPVSRAKLDRLADAFHECGRGLFVGGGLTALTQGVVATVIYAALGLPHAVVLGGLTFLAAFVPLLGTSTVWIPTAIGLALAGHAVQGGLLVALGALVIGTVDNLMRPWFVHYARLDLPTYVVALSMFGGLALVGFQGLVLGPVVVRVTLEVLAIVREDAVSAESRRAA